MATATKAARAERAEAIDKLRAMIKPGDTVYTILDHVSSSGMSRAIRVVVPYTRDDGTIDHLHPNWAVGRALDLRHWKRNGREQDALVVGGCGMDMGFHLVESLSYQLYGGRHCDCGAWYDDARPGQKLTRQDYDAREDRGGEGWHYRHDPACAKCAGGGYLLTSGYACLGKGKCPSNYHVNHRDRVRCDGHDGRICWRPSSWHNDKIPADWPRGPRVVLLDRAKGGGYLCACGHAVAGHDATCGHCRAAVPSIEGLPLACLHTEHDGAPYEVCPTCQGAGDLANPEGPERFDLRHFDGYAIRHRWL